jgi:hypothetical protein
MEIILILLYTILFLYVIRRHSFFRLPGVPESFLQGLFLLKILAGMALWSIYTFYYPDRATADIYKYFDDSAVIFEALFHSPKHYFQMISGIGNNAPEFDQYYNAMHYWARKAESGIYNDSHTIIRFNAIVRIFSFGYYNVHTVFICFLSLTGLTAIFKFSLRQLPDKKKELLCIIFLLPSVLFWGSGVLKEGLIFFALGMLIYHSDKLFSLRSLLIVLLTTALLALSKFYVWLCILPSLLLLVWLNKSRDTKPFLKYGIIVSAVAILGINIDKFSNIQNPLVTLSQKQLEFKRLASGELMSSDNKVIPAAGSAIPLAKLEPTLGSFLSNAPQALANVMFRPLPWEIRSPFMLMAGIENILILLIAALAIAFCKHPKRWPWKYMLFCLSFVILQFLIIGETTPVVGAIVRYRCIALPFLLIAFISITDKTKLVEKWRLYGRVFR